MKSRDWDSKYSKIIKEFRYDRKADLASASLLNLLLKRQFPLSRLEKIIKGKPVFVIGAGPSLKSAIPILKKYKAVKICAETALDILVKNGIRPQIIATDLDGNLQTLAKIGKTNTVFVVHAHGDNINKLEFAKNFKNCIGSTQTQEIGKIQNFGGFTDGDRCVFLANHFGASKIFLFGMDFGPRIGIYSNTKRKERDTKLKKLRWGKALLEWFAPMADAELFTLSKQIKGFRKITYRELKHSISSPE